MAPIGAEEALGRDKVPAQHKFTVVVLRACRVDALRINVVLNIGATEQAAAVGVRAVSCQREVAKPPELLNSGCLVLLHASSKDIV